MRKEKHYTELVITFPGNFQEKLQQTFEDEYEIACKKWKLSPPAGAKALIFSHAKKQLEGKMAVTCHNPWTVGQPIYSVLALSHSKAVAKLTFPLSPEDEEVASFHLVRSNDGWKVESDPASEAVLARDFATVFFEQLFQWARTAVFYGVASYGNGG